MVCIQQIYYLQNDGSFLSRHVVTHPGTPVAGTGTAFRRITPAAHAMNTPSHTASNTATSTRLTSASSPPELNNGFRRPKSAYYKLPSKMLLALACPARL